MSMMLRVAAVALFSSGGAAERMVKRRETIGRSGGKVLSLGDSFTAGTGIHHDRNAYDERYGGSLNGYNFTRDENGECFREKDTTHGPKYAASHNMESIMMACMGAESLHTTNQIDYVQQAYPSEAARNWKDSFILLSVGGNDLRTINGDTWGQLVRRCIFSFECQNDPSNEINNLRETEDKLTDLFSKLAQEASEATIRVMGYPYLMGMEGQQCWNVLGGWLVSEANWIDSLCDVLDQVVGAAVRRTKAAYPNVDLEYVSVLNYLDLGACSTDSGRHVNGAVLRWWGIAPSSFHPTQTGFDRYYQAFIDSLR